MEPEAALAMFVCDAVFALMKRWTEAFTKRSPVSAESRLRLKERLTLHTWQRSLTKRGAKRGERAKRRFPSQWRPWPKR